MGIFAATMVAAAPATNAFGILRGAGDIRRIRMYSGRTGESIDTIYWIDGKYVKELNEINYFMRDWRNNQVKGIDPRTVDIAAASHRLMGTNETLYDAVGLPLAAGQFDALPQMRGVARNSLHIRGQAADLRLKSLGQPDPRAASCAMRVASANIPGRTSFTWIAARSATGAAEALKDPSKGTLRGAFFHRGFFSVGQRIAPRPGSAGGPRRSRRVWQPQRSGWVRPSWVTKVARARLWGYSRASASVRTGATQASVGAKIASQSSRVRVAKRAARMCSWASWRDRRGRAGPTGQAPAPPARPKAGSMAPATTPQAQA